MASSAALQCRDLSVLPIISFSFVENFIKRNSKSSGREQITKGYKYFCEEYVHSLQVFNDNQEVRVLGRCYRSQRKTESPHSLEIIFSGETISSSKCSCTIGQSGCCGHITATLYQLAHYRQMDVNLVPHDIAKTSLPQTWHQPRGEKLRSIKVDDLCVRGYDKIEPGKTPRGIKSTLYNPIRIDAIKDIECLSNSLQDKGIELPTVVELPCHQYIDTKFGKFPKGCVVSYQQQLSSDYILNLMDIDSFPDLPVKNHMKNNVAIVLDEMKSKAYQSLTVTVSESIEIEKNTRLQSRDPKWHKIRISRITASNAGKIAKRRKDSESLVQRLQSGRHVLTGAMKHGLEFESIAAQTYSKIRDDNVNLYPVGIIVNPFSQWLAASPDRKVYFPERQPQYGLLEIKCPAANDFTDIKYLETRNGHYTLKRNHDYYYQVQMQLAVTGLDWCDFFVWSENQTHLETIYFDKEFWQDTKDKLDLFFFCFYLNQ